MLRALCRDTKSVLALAVVALLAQEPTAAQCTNPVAAWYLNENCGQITHDHSGYSNHGTLQGAEWSAGRWSAALLFDGVEDSVLVPYSPSLGICDQITIAAWINGDFAPDPPWSVPNYYAIVRRGAVYALGIQGRHVLASLITDAELYSRGKTILESGQWYFVAMTYDRFDPGVLADLDTFTGMRADREHNPVIPTGAVGEWDEVMREIGNVLYDAADPDPTKRYKTWYTGYCPPWATNTVYVGYAYSPDGMTWTKAGQILERPLEDPYVMLHDGVYYLYVEDKEDVPFRNIRRYHSVDCVNWLDDGDVFDVQENGPAWESGDVSSPVVWIEGDTWYLLYEGRGSATGGQIGLAWSSDGLD